MNEVRLRARRAGREVREAMRKYYDEDNAMPARVRAALSYLYHCQQVTDQCDVSIPRRELSPMEAQVRSCALRVLQLYFAGEMDFGDVPPRPPESGAEEAGNPPVPVGTR